MTTIQDAPATYVPFNYQVGDIPVIVYVMRTRVPLKELLADQVAVTKHLDLLYQKQAEKLQRGSYHIVFVWNWRGLLMTDVWLYQTSMLDPEGGNTYVDSCRAFKGLNEYAPIGLASERTIVVLGREQEHRWKFATLEEYLDRSLSLPEFPGHMKPVDAF